MPPEHRPYNVLFLCTGNSARSILAEAVLNTEGKGRFRAFSAGSFPKGAVHPLSLALLKQTGLPVEGLRSKSWDEFAKPDASEMDFVFSVCDDAAGEVCPVWPGHPVTAHWGVPEPASAEGGDAQKMQAFREALRVLTTRIRVFVALPFEKLDRLKLKTRLDDIGRADLRALATEALGTALLVAGVVGSGIMAQHLTRDGALALLCNTVATGALLTVLILIFGPVSKAHFNPVVTLAFALRGDIGIAKATAYIIAQIAGGVAGTWTAHLMFGLKVFALGATARSGIGQWIAEGVATFGLLMTIFGCAARRDESVAYAVGLYITAAYWFTASTSFANPAVTIARALTPSFAGIRPEDVPAFIGAQIAGGILAVFASVYLFALTPPPWRRWASLRD